MLEVIKCTNCRQTAGGVYRLPSGEVCCAFCLSRKPAADARAAVLIVQVRGSVG